MWMMLTTFYVMNAKQIFFFFLFFSQITIAQIKQFDIGKSFKINSKILHEEREFWIHLPRNYDKKSSRTYPVLYVLDGQSHFFSLTGMVDQLSENGNTKFPEMIIVGIVSTLDRTRDLTPTHINGESYYMDSTACIDSGGNDSFIAFLEKELIPHVHSSYSASSYRLLIGHSFGGLAVMNILLKHTALFKDYIVIDPSVWWDDKYILKETIKNIQRINFMGKSLYLGIANTTADYVNKEDILQDTNYTTDHIRAIFNLERVCKETKTDLCFDSKFYPSDTHSSVPLITSYDGLHFIFKNFEFKLPLYDTTIVDSLFLSKIKNHSIFLYETYGYGTPISEEFIGECAYIALDSKHYNEALYLFELNIKNYPSHWESYFSLGDYYSELSDFDNALKNYKKAYKILHYFVIKTKIEETKKILETHRANMHLNVQ